MSKQRRSAITLAVLGGCLVGACVQPDPPGVAIRPLKADIVFGVKDAVEPATPASFDTDADSTAPRDLGDVELALPPQPSDSPSKPLPKRSVPLLRAADPCPAAKVNAFPLLEAPRGVTTQPTPGVYRWRTEGNFKVNVNGTDVVIPRNGFQQRIVSNVSEITTTPNPVANNPTAPGDDTKVFTFQMSQATPSGLTKRITYQVKTGALGVKEEPGVEVPQPVLPTTPLGSPPTTAEPPDLPNGIAVGDPERGITIKKIEDVDSDGNVQHESVYSPGVAVLPLAVLPGEAFRSVGVDNRNQVTLVHDGFVKNRARVDACGDIVDGWEVQINATLVDGPSAQVTTVTYYFATQYGGMPILEKVDYGDGGYTDSLGQLNPDPLPEG